MTKALIQTIVVIGCMTGFWISISTKLDTNSKASGDVSSALKEQVEAYRSEANRAQATILTHVDTTQGFVTTAISQNSALAEQNQQLLASIDGLTKEMLVLTEQNADLLRQIKTVNDNQTKILTEHTQTLQKAKLAAESAQVDTRRALRAIVKPTPKPWFYGIFPSSTPKRKR